jgi:hypothetical protein
VLENRSEGSTHAGVYRCDLKIMSTLPFVSVQDPYKLTFPSVTLVQVNFGNSHFPGAFNYAFVLFANPISHPGRQSPAVTRARSLLPGPRGSIRILAKSDKSARMSRHFYRWLWRFTPWESLVHTKVANVIPNPLGIVRHPPAAAEGPRGGACSDGHAHGTMLRIRS